MKGLSRRGFLSSVSAGAVVAVSLKSTPEAPAQEIDAVGKPVTINLLVNGSLEKSSGRASLDACLCVARSPWSYRNQNWLRTRRMRRLHSTDRRQAPIFLHDSCRRSRRPSRSPPSKVCWKTTNLAPSSRLSPKKMLSSADSALPARSWRSRACCARNPNPTLDQIRIGVSGNLCRCGSYKNIFNAAAKAADLRKQKGGA